MVDPPLLGVAGDECIDGELAHDVQEEAAAGAQTTEFEHHGHADGQRRAGAGASTLSGACADGQGIRLDAW